LKRRLRTGSKNPKGVRKGRGPRDTEYHVTRRVGEEKKGFEVAGLKGKKHSYFKRQGGNPIWGESFFAESKASGAKIGKEKGRT